jgi:tRNA nucleotidyltransferase (CCA-adding enzyme)
MERELPIPPALQAVLKDLPSAMVVGGAVRDWLGGLAPKDIDVEVYKTREEDLKAHLGNFGRLDEVGKAFGVIKLTIDGETYDFSLPRRDSKSGSGHKEFRTEYDPNMPPEEAAKRRDITINSMGWNPAKKELIDPYNGQADLERKIIRHTSIHFSEDPLRPLRCFQFAARLSMELAPETAALCQTMADEDAFSHLPKERVSEEFAKFLLKGTSHRKGLEALVAMGWAKFFPEIEALNGLEQDHQYHPEGDVLTHTGYCLESLPGIKTWKESEPERKLLLAYAVLCHDLGKATTTRREWKKSAGRIAVTSNGHEREGFKPTESLAKRIGLPVKVIEAAQILTVQHMAHLQVKTEKEVKKLATALSPKNPHADNAKLTTNIQELAVIVEADHSGRPPLEKGRPGAMENIVQIATRLGCLEGPQKPFLSGKSLLSEPLPVGRAMGEVLRQVYQAQIDGTVTDPASAMDWMRKNKRKILAETKSGPEPLITGKELMEAGVPRGPHLTRLASKAYDLQLTGEITSKAEGLKKLERLIAKEVGPTMQ